MDHFIYTYHGPGKTTNFREKAAHARLKQNKKITEFKGQTFWLTLEICENHIFSNIKGEEGIFLLGRDSAKISGDLNLADFIENASFPYLYLQFGSIPGQIEIYTDRFGLFPYFFSSYEDHFIITNYLPAIMHFWGENLEIDPTAQQELLQNGTLELGKSLFKNVSMSHPLYNIEVFDFAHVQLQLKKKLILTKKEKATSLFYQEMKKSVADILITSPIRWITLTGGADSRLIFSTLQKDRIGELTFLFDNIAADPQQIPYDEPIVEILKKEFSLRFRYGFPLVSFSEAQSFIGSQVDGPHNFILTGLFGGEIVGGQALDAQPFQTSCAINYECERKKFRDYISSESDLFYYLSLMVSSFMGFFYEDRNWMFPFTIAQKKITPYLNTKLIEIVLSQEEQDVLSFSFYQQIYKEHAKELIKIPFHSKIARVGDDNFIDIKGKLLSDQNQLVSSLDSADILRKRNMILQETLTLLRREVSFM